MESNDLKAFRDIMKALAEIFDAGDPPSPVKIELYFKALQEFSIDDIKLAAAEIVKTRVYPDFPKPAEFRKILDVREAGDPMLAWGELMACLERGGPNFSDPVIPAVVKAMGGWQHLSMMSYRDLDFAQARFVDMYKSMAHKRGDLGLIEGGYHNVLRLVPGK
jgi:hypothetical protein